MCDIITEMKCTIRDVQKTISREREGEGERYSDISYNISKVESLAKKNLAPTVNVLKFKNWIQHAG